MRKKSTDKPVSLHPTIINEIAWFYENEYSIDMVIEARDKDGQYLATAQCRVPKEILKRLKP